MKPSHFITPRSLDAAYFDPRGQALHGFTGGGRESSVASICLAVVLGILGAVALVHWMAS